MDFFGGISRERGRDVVGGAVRPVSKHPVSMPGLPIWGMLDVDGMHISEPTMCRSAGREGN